jgi:hypothetical protein
MTMLDERTDVREDTGTQDPDEGNGFMHYFRKDHLDAQMLNPGLVIVAACGFKRAGLANPAANLPVCPKCKDIYENRMRPGDDE